MVLLSLEMMSGLEKIVIVLCNVKIGDGACLGQLGSIVTRDIPPYAYCSRSFLQEYLNLDLNQKQ